MDIVQLVTGLLIAGESILLYILMRMRKSPWLTPVNEAYVVIDVIVGLILLASGYSLIPPQGLILITSALVHIYRDYEVIQRLENRYAFNIPLLIVLNIRIIGLLYIILV